VQGTPIGDMVLDVPALIDYCSTFTRLVPGDVIVTGIPAGRACRSTTAPVPP